VKASVSTPGVEKLDLEPAISDGRPIVMARFVARCVIDRADNDAERHHQT
jgi:hypothetical protein